MKDYLAMTQVEPEDREDHGIMGMKWGRRRSEAQLADAVKTRAAAGAKVTPTAKAKTVLAKDSTPDHLATVKDAAPETSQARYNRLARQVKETGSSHKLSDADLKFLNSRTEAMAKVNKMFGKKPNWIAAAAKDVAQNTAKQQMAAISASLANKYITDRMNQKPAQTLEEAIAKSVSDIQRKSAVDAGVNRALETSDYIGRHKKSLPGTPGYRGKRSK